LSGDSFSTSDHGFFQQVIKEDGQTRRKQHKYCDPRRNWESMQIFERKPNAEEVRQVNSIGIFGNQVGGP
jgi:hypothetical protein